MNFDRNQLLMKSDSKLPIREEVKELNAEILSIDELIKQLPTAARLDAKPKIERVKTMAAALGRGISEQKAPGDEGADAVTVAALYCKLKRETTSLGREMATLDQGAPTTISAVGDVAIETIESVASKLNENVEHGIEIARSKISSDS